MCLHITSIGNPRRSGHIVPFYLLRATNSEPLSNWASRQRQVDPAWEPLYEEDTRQLGAHVTVADLFPTLQGDNDQLSTQCRAKATAKKPYTPQAIHTSRHIPTQVLHTYVTHPPSLTKSHRHRRNSPRQLSISPQKRVNRTRLNKKRRSRQHTALGNIRLRQSPDSHPAPQQQ